MELKLYILNGIRRGEVISLSEVNKPTQKVTPWVLEDEAIEFSLKVLGSYKAAILEVYEHSILASKINSINDERVTEFTWSPAIGDYQIEKLFFNYFGLSELKITLLDYDGGVEKIISYQPLQVAAKKSSAKDVEEMFEYLSEASSEVLHCAFSATRKSAGFSDGVISPTHIFDKLQYSVDLLQKALPELFHKSITRLTPVQRLVPTSGKEELDDASIGWLLENLSVLEPNENPDQAHVYYDGQHYRASTMCVPILTENSDIYENRVIHGFLEFLLREAQQLLQRYNNILDSSKAIRDLPDGYISFFDKLSRFKSQLMDFQINRIERIIEPIKQLKSILDYKLPVSRVSGERPVITFKVRNNSIYREVFLEIIKWHELGAVDWSAYENLLAIQSIPVLFEFYCYFRVVESINLYFNGFDSGSMDDLELGFEDANGNQVIIEKEPNYWTSLHASRHIEGIVNSEGYTIKHKSNFTPRGQTGPNSRRQPDIVIQLKNPEKGTVQLLVIDAKYTSSKLAFVNYLPELTMKYVHGIHLPEQEQPTVTSLTILYPDKSKSALYSYHYKEMGLFGSYPVKPSLQTLGLVLGSKRKEDMLNSFIERLFEVNGVSRLC